MLNRRDMLLSGTALLAACAAGAGPGRRSARPEYVTRDGAALRLAGRPYRFAGSNMWYAAWLGAGEPSRLTRELDGLAAMGVTNLRIAASAELSPLKNSARPTFRDQSANYSETLLKGLDRALAEMGRRGIRGVLYLTNFWEWSGGMMTYHYWTNGGRYIDMNDPAHPWPEFPDMVSNFYASPQAVAMYHDYVRAVVTRTNTITGVPYAEDPAIMAWQLANEPRPAGSEKVARERMDAFLKWVSGTAGLIKSLDSNHLVSTGSEGLQGCLGDESCVIAEHMIPEIDYLTTHIWPLNWSWVDSADLPGTWAGGEAKVRDYMAKHVALATRLGKPVVFEEFGFPRDQGLFDPGTPTTYKDRFYQLIYDEVLASARTGGPLVGSNFWAWNGSGRASHPDHRFVRGDPYFLGDPPHEPQGWYGVFDTDASTKAVIAAHAKALAAI
jgi:mannan endo-1,4-beta-mannosidase